MRVAGVSDMCFSWSFAGVAAGRGFNHDTLGIVSYVLREEGDRSLVDKCCSLAEADRFHTMCGSHHRRQLVAASSAELRVLKRLADDQLRSSIEGEET
jgi:hypothetical protein